MKIAAGIVLAALATATLIKSASAQTKDVVDTAFANPQFSTWAKAVKQSGMDSTLHLTPGKFTLFVPTNAAFAKMPPATLKKLFDESSEGQEALTALVMRHAIVGTVLHAADLKPGSLKTIMGPPVTVKTAKVGSGRTVNNAHIVQADINASNGVIHAVDMVFPK